MGLVQEILSEISQTGLNVVIEVVDLRDYNLPFFDEVVEPAFREVITDPCIKAWSEKISVADAFIMVVPSYNGGYPGVLKNALDYLYEEWNNKPVCLVGYAENSSGGNSAINQLHFVTKSLKMILVRYAVKIPHVSEILDEYGNCTDSEIEKKIDKCIDATVMYVLHPELIPLTGCQERKKKKEKGGQVTPCQERRKKEKGGQGEFNCP
jgi:NAD(P)H-dependent FMN reductase